MDEYIQAFNIFIIILIKLKAISKTRMKRYDEIGPLAEYVFLA